MSHDSADDNPPSAGTILTSEEMLALPHSCQCRFERAGSGLWRLLTRTGCRPHARDAGQAPSRLSAAVTRPVSVASLKTSVRVLGQDQLDVWHAMCAASGRRSHQLAADLILDAIQLARKDPQIMAIAAGLQRSRQPNLTLVACEGGREAEASRRKRRHPQ